MITEALCYALIFTAEAVIALLYFDYIYLPKDSRRDKIIRLTLGYTFLFAVSFIKLPWLNIIAFWLVNAVILLTGYQCKIRTAVFQSSILSFIMVATEFLVNLVLSKFTGDFNAFSYSLVALIAMAAFSRLLYLLFTVFAARLFRPHKQRAEEPSIIFLLASAPVLSAVIIIAFSYIGFSCDFEPETELLTTAGIISLLFLNLILLFIYNRVQELDREKLQLQIEHLREQADAEYYEMLQTQYENQRLLIHDIKSHLNSIDTLVRNNDAEAIGKYISELEALPELHNRVRLCSEPILNMVLTRYAGIFEARGINFICDIRAGSVSFLDSTSTTALFGNLLSNAVEACERSCEKQIELSAKKGTSSVITMVNSCETPPIRDEAGNFISTKGDAAAHGYGMKSIEKTVKKFGGTYTAYYKKDEKQFHFVIQFPPDAGQKATQSSD